MRFGIASGGGASRWTWLKCLVGAHEWLLLREPTRLSVQCIHCMRVTKGLALR